VVEGQCLCCRNCFLWITSRGRLVLDFFVLFGLSQASVSQVWESSRECSRSWVVNSSLETREGCLYCCVVVVRRHCVWSVGLCEGGERLLDPVFEMCLSDVPPFFGYRTSINILKIKKNGCEKEFLTNKSHNGAWPLSKASCNQAPSPHLTPKKLGTFPKHLHLTI
jgi:hypothetical protein